MPYVTVFDISQKPFEWWWPAFCFFFAIIGIAFIKFGDRLGVSKDVKWVGWFFVIFGSGTTLAVLSLTYSTYREYLNVYRTGQYSVAEGVVEDFHPMPYEGHQSECFRVDKAKFCYSDYEVSPGFNQSASHGGPIRAGLPVRIAYYQDGLQESILRLEIRADSLPSGPERTAYSKTEEEKWHQWAKDNPGTDRLQLGFSFAALLISLCLNLDWRHYIRYWIRRGPPYARIVELGFRAFFLASLVGSGIQFLRMISEKQRTIVDFEKAAGYSLILIGFFGIYDLITRRRLRAENQSPEDPTHSASKS